MKAPEEFSLDALEVALDERQAARREALSERDDKGELLFVLSLVPQWTDELIRRIVPGVLSRNESMFRLRRTDIGDGIDELDRRGFLQRAAGVRVEIEDEPPAVVQVDSEVAERQISRRLEQKDGRDSLERSLVALGSAILDVARSDGAMSRGRVAERVPAYLPRITVRWSWLASAGELRGGLLSGGRVTSWQPAVERFEGRIDESLTFLSSTHEALRWIEAAQPLAALLARVLETSLDLAVRRASLALELRDRRRHDLKHLESFLEREDQIGALLRLIDSPDAEQESKKESKHEPWALHLLGSGGVGKTMLLRHLTARMAEERSLTVGRVDFDFLNPDYPRLAPGLLLWAFAQELRVFDTSGKVSAVFEDSERVLRQLHEELQGGASTIRRATDHQLFAEGLELYAQALELLPEPVTLVIDTCEELTKPRAGVDAHFNVEETFRILESLHERLPSLRVVFAGRRPLARSGAGWRCKSCDLPARPYLALFEMRGFTKQEAERYLEAGGVPEELIEPVIHRSSPDAGAAAQIEWQEGDVPDDVPRCNPYELRFFAEWARDTPPPSPQDIESAGGERYVELRILRRLGDRKVAELLPIFGLARHLDAELIGVLTGLEGQALDDFLHGLLQQEWIERRPASSSGEVRWVYSVEEGLRLRLAGYFKQRPSQLEEQRREAAHILARRLLGGDPAELDFTDLDAALRVVAAEPDADYWWRDVEQRLFELRDRQWVGQQAGLLTGPEGVAGLPDEASWPELRVVHPLRPAVLGTFALAESDEPGGGLTPWMEVAETASSLPIIGADLELRAKAMELAAGLAVGQEPSPEEAREVWRLAGRLRGLPSPETAASLVTALEAAVERYEEDPRDRASADRLRLVPADLPAERRDEIDSSLVTRWMLHVFEVWRGVAAGRIWIEGTKQLGLESMLYALDGRVTAALGDESEKAVSSFERAVDLADERSHAPWLAWARPEWLRTRIQLEALRALCPSVLSPAKTFRAFGGVEPAEGVEIDRFFSAVAELGLAAGLRSEAFQVAATAEAGPLDLDMLCHAHRELPPLELQQARMDAASGEIERAFRKWGEIARDAASHDVHVVRHAARAELRWAIRLRHWDGELGAALAESSREDDQELMALAAEISGRSFERKPLAVRDSLRVVHAAWQRSPQPTEESLEETMRIANHRLGQTDAESCEAKDVHVILDGLEAALLAGERTAAGELARFVGEINLDRFPQAEACWRLHLRRRALFRWHDQRTTEQLEAQVGALDRDRIGRLGTRRAGLIAWSEADFLALRKPSAAAILFAVAHRLLVDAADHVGAAICLTAECCCLVTGSPELVQRGFEDLHAAWRRAGVALERQTEKETLEQALQSIPTPLRTWWLRANLLPWFLSDIFAVRQQVPVHARRWLRGAEEPLAAWLKKPPGGSPRTSQPPGVRTPPAPPVTGKQARPPQPDSTRALPSPSSPTRPAAKSLVSRLATVTGMLRRIPGRFVRSGKPTPLGVGIAAALVSSVVGFGFLLLDASFGLVPPAVELPVILGLSFLVVLLVFRWLGWIGDSPALSGDDEERTILVATQSSLGRDIALGAYSGLRAHGIDIEVIEGRALEALAQGKSKRSERVIHLIGSVIQSSAGLRFRLDRAKRWLDLSPFDLAARFPRASLVLLQLEPMHSSPSSRSPRRRALEREAEWLVEFSNQVRKSFEKPVAVASVPQASSQASVIYIEELARFLRPRRGVLRILFGEYSPGAASALFATNERLRRRLQKAELPSELSQIEIRLSLGSDDWRHPFASKKESS